MLCPLRKLGYIHIFKSGGTTIMSLFRDACPGAIYIRSWAGACDFPPCGSWKHAAANRARHDNYAFFTFVRDPVERFASAVYEVSRRGFSSAWRKCRPKLAVKTDGEDGRLALSVLEHCVVQPSMRLPRRVDPHFEPQINFMLDDASVLNQLKFVGRVENLSEDLRAILQSHSLNVNEAQLAQTHLRRSGDAGFHRPGQERGKGILLNVSGFTDDNRRTILRAYSTDVRSHV